MSDYPSGYVSLLSGWLQSGQVTTYNADGQVTAQAQFGRWGTNWTSLGLQDDMGTLPDETSSTPTISSDDALTRGGIYRLRPRRPRWPKNFVDSLGWPKTVGRIGPEFLSFRLKNRGGDQKVTRLRGVTWLIG